MAPPEPHHCPHPTPHPVPMVECNPPIYTTMLERWMLMLGKPQKPATSPYNLRPIALQDPVGKALVGLLIQTANADAQPLLMPWPIWAYLPKRSTLDAVCRVAYHCGQVKKLVASQKPPPMPGQLQFPCTDFAAE